MDHKEKIKKRKFLRELRKAKAELSMLTCYLSDCEEMMIQYSAEWAADIKLILDKLEPTIKDHTEKSEEQVSSKNKYYRESGQKKFQEECRLKSNTPEWAKKAFRKIALKTHPDKIKNQKNFQELEDLYAQANEAVSSEDYDLLLEICNLLSIENEIDPELELEYNGKKQQTIKTKLEKITDSIPWAWGEAYDNITLRQNLLLSILPHYGVEGTTASQVLDILKKI